MSTKTKSSDVLSREDKRGRFVAPEEKQPNRALPAILVVGCLVALAVVGGALFFSSRPSSAATDAPTGVATSGHDPYPVVAAEDGVVRLSLSVFDDDKAHYYTYMQEGRPIELFALKSKDGVVRAAFNACDVCFQAKRGYRQEGDVMVCNNCGRRFPSEQINVVQGGCNPAPLQRSVEGGDLVIRVEDIAAGQGYF